MYKFLPPFTNSGIIARGKWLVQRCREWTTMAENSVTDKKMGWRWVSQVSNSFWEKVRHGLQEKETD